MDMNKEMDYRTFCMENERPGPVFLWPKNADKVHVSRLNKSDEKVF